MSTAPPESSFDLLKMSGWLKKKGKTSGLWHRRFVVLSGSELTIAKDETLKTIEQTIALSPSIVVETVEAESPRFKIEVPGADAILFATATQEEAMRWVTATKSALSPMPKLSMENFQIISVVGRGFYGKVMLVQKTGTKELYAIKSIHKSRLVESGNSGSVIAERNVMMKAKHPFIVSLCFAFQTQSKFYLGLEYVGGGELFYHMDSVGTIPINDARLYVAEIGLALSYLHSLGIVYRDLKPENILIDADGHMKLTDFGLAKELSIQGQTSTFCGTSEYLAPEVVMQQPYSYPIDIWALGILTYEMILGTTPFTDENKSVMFNNIVKNDVTFPPMLDSRISDFISKLLTKNPNDRPTFEQMKSHPFFEGFDWTKVYNREYRPSFVPQIKDPLSTTNFDPEFTSELAADSFVQPAIGDVGNIQGFSYYDPQIQDL